VFPGGQIAVQVSPQPPHTTVLTTRIADVRFVLDSTAAIAAGAHPDAGHHPLPVGLPAAQAGSHIVHVTPAHTVI
jgi:hypothetical protein